MPKFTRLSDEQVEKLMKRSKKGGESQRQQTRQQYVDYLKQYKPGEWISVDLDSDENKQTVRNRLTRAAKTLGWKLNFVRSRGPIRFQIIEGEK
jgi:hypothetical protein